MSVQTNADSGTVVATGAQVIHASATAAPPVQAASGPAHAILWTMCLAHFFNDLLQALIPAILPILKDAYNLDFLKVGIIAAAFQVSASLFQPVVGHVADKRHFSYALPFGMAATIIGLAMLAWASVYMMILLACVLVGFGSAIFHPEGSRVCRMAAGGRHGLAQSTFQVGGNFGQASGPLMAAFIIVPLGQQGLAWFTLLGLVTLVLLTMVGRWYGQQVQRVNAGRKPSPADTNPYGLTRGTMITIIFLLLMLVFSKTFYSSSISTFYTFYLMEKFSVSLRDAQLYLFLFMGSVAAGVYFGGPIGDRIGRKNVIWISILGALPFTLALPFANLFWAAVLTVIIGFITSASLPQIVVYALELMPGRVGLVSGLFLGFAFGMSGIGAAFLGYIADVTSLDFVFRVCAFLPAIGLIAWWLPDTRERPAQ